MSIQDVIRLSTTTQSRISNVAVLEHFITKEDVPLGVHLSMETQGEVMSSDESSYSLSVGEQWYRPEYLTPTVAGSSGSFVPWGGFCRWVTASQYKAVLSDHLYLHDETFLS